MKSIENFSLRLEECLKEKNMNRADLARYLETSQSTVFSWVREDYLPSLEKALQMADLFNINLKWLAWGEGEKVKDVGIKVQSEDEKHHDINEIWDMLPPNKQEELLNYGRYLCAR